MKDSTDFYTDSVPLVTRFNKFAERHGLTGVARADHICYKCASKEEFERTRALFESESAFVYQSIISNRRIAIIGMRRVVETALGVISVLELSDQKPDGSQKSGFDHIEIYPTGISYDALAKKIEKSGTTMKRVVRPHHTTIDISLDGGYLVRLTEEPLVEKIKREEMR